MLVLVVGLAGGADLRLGLRDDAGGHQEGKGRRSQPVHHAPHRAQAGPHHHRHPGRRGRRAGDRFRVRHALSPRRSTPVATGYRQAARAGQYDSKSIAVLPVRQHVLRPRAGVLLRRHLRGNPQFAGQGQGTESRRPHLLVRLQGPEPGPAPDRRHAGRRAHPRRLGAQGRHHGANHRPADPGRRWLPPVVGDLRPRTGRRVSRSRTKSPTPFWNN